MANTDTFQMFYHEPIEKYANLELKQALNSWLIQQEPVAGYHPGHDYSKPVKIDPPTYAFYMGVFCAEASKRGLKITPITEVPDGQKIFFIEGTYEMKKYEDGSIYILQANDTKRKADVYGFFLH